MKPVLLRDTIQPQFVVAALDRKDDRELLRLAVRMISQRDEVMLHGHHVDLR